MSDLEGSTVEQKSQREPLILQRAAITRRIDALFKAMATDFLLREQFVTDPAQVISEYVYGTRISLQKASVINQLLYSVMSNQSLLSWLRDYSMKHSGHPPTSQEFMSDFGRAVVEYGGHHVVLALARGSVEKESVFNFDEALLPAIFGIFTGGSILAAGTEMSTGGGGTQMSTGTGGTEMSTGQRLAAQSLVAGTEMSTGGGGTEMSTGQRLMAERLAAGTEMSTGGGGTQMSTGTGGTEMSTGQRLAAGTEMSTGGGGTQMSTGTGGTEMSTGQRLAGSIGIFRSGYQSVALEALAQYATHLREIGALDAI